MAVDANNPWSGDIQLEGGVLTQSAIKDFFASNPSSQQVLQRASQLGMTQDQLRQAVNSAGLLFDNGNMASPSMNGAGGRQGLYNQYANDLWTGEQGYGLDSYGMAGGNARIVAGTGHNLANMGNGAEQWQEYGTGQNSAGPGNGGFGSSGGSGGGNLGMGASGSQGQSQGGGQNPYLAGMGQNIINQMTENYTRNQLPASRSGAMAAGGFGGSRQGVVEANGLNDLNRGIGQNLTNLYGQDWTNAQNRNLQQQSINNSYDLGLRSNDLGYANLDSNNQQFGANYGLNVMNAQNNWAQQGVQAANGIQNTPIDYSRYFQGQTSQMAGQGGSTTNAQTNQANPWLGALGGAQLANSWFNGQR